MTDYGVQDHAFDYTPSPDPDEIYDNWRDGQADELALAMADRNIADATPRCLICHYAMLSTDRLQNVCDECAPEFLKRTSEAA